MAKGILFTLIFLYYSIKLFKANINLNENKNFKIKCGVDKIKSQPQNYNASQYQNQDIKHRKLDSNDEYQSIRIHISNRALNLYLYTYLSLRNKFRNNLNEVVDYIEKLIKVKPYNQNIRIDRDVLINNNLCYGDESDIICDDTITGQGINTDLVIFPIILPIFEPSLMYSQNIFKDSLTNRTIVAGLFISPLVLSKNYSDFYYKSLFFHEITHILGFLYDSFQYFPGGLENTIKTQIDSRGINRTYIITPKVVQLAKKYYNCDNIIGLELEDQKDDEEHISSHWEGRILLGEYMNSIQYKPEVVLSEFTLALLEDSGWYKVNYFTGGLMRFGKNKGCNFLNNDCCNNAGITFFKNEFFDLVDNNNPSCSSGRLSRTYNKYREYDIFSNDIYRRFTNNNKIGGIAKNADYCLTFIDIESEDNHDNMYLGNCKIGNGNYGSNIIYNDHNIYKNSENEEELQEKYSNNSFCILSEVFPKGNTNEENIAFINKYNSIIHPICYEMFCSNYSLTIKIKDQYVVCPRKGGKVEINGNFQGYIYCPDYNLICTGTIMCNDMFDCIEKGSEPRNSTYDYEFNNEKTSSQKISQIKNENLVYGYEINENGICPAYCSQCKNIKRCFKCIEGFILLGNKENDNDPIICDNRTNTSIGYFIKENVNYPCIEYCNICNSSFDCLKCDNIHKTNYDRTQCIDKVENCESYSGHDFICDKCKGEYVFIGDDRENCVIINDKSRYYTLDNGISYFPCNHSISNCDICNNNKNLCSKCNENYYFINDNRTFCFNDKNLSKYYTIDNGVSYILCNNTFPFCDTCNSIICQTCEYNYYFIKLNRTYCVTGYNLNQYYTEDNGLSYYPCNEVLNNCDECNNKHSCEKCENNYYFIGDNRLLCRNDFNKSKYYTEDNGISYYPCYTHFEFCDECTNRNTCTKCLNNYGFIGFDRSKCIYIGNNEYFTENGGISYIPCNTNLLNCQQCSNRTYCLKCNETYYFIAYDRTRCFGNYNLNEYYTEDNGTSYFPCNTGIPNCKNCSSKYNCTMCQATYYFIGYDRNFCINDRNLVEYYTLDQGISYFPCHEVMENCKNCIVPTICMECQENTYFLRNDTSKCLSLNLKGYYKEGISYYPCYESMNYCAECYSKNFCSKCNINYFLKYEITNICFDLATFQNDKTYYKLNETHYKKCSSSMDNCLYCDSGTECIQCENNYYFLNDNTEKCININQLVPNDEFYKIDDKNYYSCEYNKIVENCKKCNNSFTCLLCKDEYAFLSDNFNKCHLKDNMQIGYYHNEKETIFYPCIVNCDYCINGKECQQCALNNELIFDNTVCDICKTNISYITDELNLEIIHSYVEKYFEETKNTLTLIKHYINQNNNYSITIFRSWECTKYLLSEGYFYLDVKNITKNIIEKNEESLSSLTYIFVNYGEYKNYIEIYNSKERLLNLRFLCPECLETEFTIKNNITNAIISLFGKVIVNNIVINDINVFNETENIFSSFCSNFTIENIDIPLKERREMLYLGNQANEIICLESSCEIENITIRDLTGSCQCKIKSELSRILEETSNVQFTFDNIGKNNFPIFTCYKEGFNKNNLKSNIGFFIGIVLIVIQILSFILYIISSKPRTKVKITANPPNPTNPESPVQKNNSEMLYLENFDEIMKENGMNRNKDKDNYEMNFQDKDELSEEYFSQDDEDFENKKTIDHLLSTEGPLSQRGKKNAGKLKDFAIGTKFDTYSVKIRMETKKKEKLLFKDSENDSNSIKYSRNRKRSSYSKNSEVISKSSFESADDYKLKEIQKKNNSAKVCDSLLDAKKFNQISFCGFYCFILGLRQPIINLFVSNKCLCLGDDYVPLSIKIIRFIFIITLNIFMNTLHLNHKYFYNKFKYFDKKYDLKNVDLEKISSTEIFVYAFLNSIISGFVSFIFCYLVQELLNRFVFNNRKKMDYLLNSKNGNVKRHEIMDVLTKPRLKYIIVIIINFIFMLGFYFFIVNFFAVYRGGIIDYLAAATWTFIFIQIFPFILCFIFAIFRYIGIKNSNDKLYKAGQLLIY